LVHEDKDFLEDYTDCRKPEEYKAIVSRQIIQVNDKITIPAGHAMATHWFKSHPSR